MSRCKKSEIAERNELIRQEYPTGNLEELRARLGITMESLLVYASRMRIKRDKTVHYAAISVSNKRIAKKDKVRINWGLPQKTGWHLAEPLSKRQWRSRCLLRENGYIPGDFRIQGERKVIFYTDKTVRHKRAEKHAEKIGLRFVKIEE